MDWNRKSSPQWDWDNLVTFNGKAAELPKKLQSTDWGNYEGGENEFGSLSSYVGGFGSVTGYGSGSGGYGSGSDMVHISSSKSSKSTSIDSSSILKASKFTFEGSNEDVSNNKELTKAKNATASSISHEASVGSGEPVIGLKLGKRTYFEDFYAGSNAKASSFSVIPVLSEPTAKRSRLSNQTILALQCQVEGCSLDLSSAKEYHRKHRICESHSKCPKVIVGGLERRFCQQCSRFHSLGEFDEKKQSCRKRLFDHNARRRKPRGESSHFDFGGLDSPSYDGRQQMGVTLSKFPHLHARPPTNAAWESPLNSKFTITRDYSQMRMKSEGTDERLHFSNNVLSNSISILSHNSNRLLPPKGSAKVSTEDVKECVLSSNMVAAQDLHRALSLLSTNPWGSCEPSNDHLVHINNTSAPHSMVHAVTQGLPLASPECIQTEQQSTDCQSHFFSSQSNSSFQFQEFMLFKKSCGSGYGSNQFN